MLTICNAIGVLLALLGDQTASKSAYGGVWYCLHAPLVSCKHMPSVSSFMHCISSSISIYFLMMLYMKNYLGSSRYEIKFNNLTSNFHALAGGRQQLHMAGGATDDTSHRHMHAMSTPSLNKLRN
jgi:hypothetical protein